MRCNTLRMRMRVGLSALAAVIVAAWIAPIAVPARSHVLRATYSGSGAGQLSGAHASGSATATGRGNVLGSSTLSGAAAGVLKSSTCLSLDGNARRPHGSCGQDPADARTVTISFKGSVTY
jgi:hypothetical protein